MWCLQKGIEQEDLNETFLSRVNSRPLPNRVTKPDPHIEVASSVQA
jgi:hypothetical protein